MTPRVQRVLALVAGSPAERERAQASDGAVRGSTVPTRLAVLLRWLAWPCVLVGIEGLAAVLPDRASVEVHGAITIALIVTLIIRFRVDPIIALVLSCLYLGCASGLGVDATANAITSGFGDIMARSGLLIAFGVLIGSLLHSLGAFRTMVDALVRRVPPAGLSYGLAAGLATLAPSIYVDVQFILAAPMVRAVAGQLGRRGLPLLTAALTAGMFCGYVFVIPGLAATSIAGVLNVPLGQYVLYGVVIAIVTAIMTVWLFSILLRGDYWQPQSDEHRAQEAAPDAATAARTTADSTALDQRCPSLLWSFMPILVPLALISCGYVHKTLAFFGNANIALFLGLLGAYGMACHFLGRAQAAEAIANGLRATGAILLVTGVAGSLGAVIKSAGLSEALASMFTLHQDAPVMFSILLAWFIAVVLHIAVGSVSVAAITAAGIMAPIVTSLNVAPVIIALAIASGSLFALHVNSNLFWMSEALLGLSTKGALKTMTMATSIASVVSLPLVIAVAMLG